MFVRCCGVIVLALAVSLGVLLTYGRHSRVMAGNFPFLLNEMRITEESIPDLENKVIIVTGANTGLGKSTTKHLVSNGAKVIMGCRSMKKCTKAKNDIVDELLGPKSKNSKSKNKFKTTNLLPMELDLGSFESIKNFSSIILEKYNRLDSLILNAGVMHTPFGLTKDGIEQQIGVNHFGHFYLTKLLLPLIEISESSTIVSVTSVGHHMSYSEGVKLSLEALNSEADYNPIQAYGQSKLANILFAQELSRQLMSKGTKVYVNAVHPGGVNTELYRHYPVFVQKAVRWLFETFPNKIMFESDLAALVEVYAAVSEEIFEKEISGKYLVPIGEVVDTNDNAKNMELQEAFWKLSGDIIRAKGFSF